MRRTGILFKKPGDVDLDTAREMALVGIVPTADYDPIGARFTMAGQVFVVIGRATREEWLSAVEAAGFNRSDFDGPCPFNKFERIITD